MGYSLPLAPPAILDALTHNRLAGVSELAINERYLSQLQELSAVALSRLGLSEDHSSKQLQQFETKVRSRGELDPYVLAVLGFYLGQVIIKTIKGSEWGEVTASSLVVRIPVQVRSATRHADFQPVLFLAKALQDPSINIHTCYRALRLMSLWDLDAIPDLGQCDPDNWLVPSKPVQKALACGE